MTIGGALSELNNLLKADNIPIYYKPSILKIIETIELEQEPCEDCVSRKEAIFALNDAQVEYDENYKGLGEAKEIIDNLPPVQPIRSKGEWIENPLAENPHKSCPYCGYKLFVGADNFCPNCGADMRGEE